MKKFLLILISSLFLFGFTGKVVKVADGDTITVLTNNKEQKRIRLFGIDCPEKKQDFGQVAKQFTSAKVFGQTVEVEEKDTDRYGRIVGIVNFGDNYSECLNADLLKAGLAWVYTHYYKGDEYFIYEANAKQNKLGLWQYKNPTPPWEFRKNNKHIK
jgi:micrococcal nuclease